MKLRDIFTFLLTVMLLIACTKDKDDLAEVVTAGIMEVSSTSAVSGGEVLFDGGSEVTMRGVCWSLNDKPTINDDHTNDGTGTGYFESSVTGLTPNTEYYLRAYATNNRGTAYGKTLSFKTQEEAVLLEDIEGNLYKTVQIGEQIWMAENLKVRKYSNGDDIPNITGEQWDDLTSGAWCFYDNNSSNISTYGLMYNWFAAVDTRNICPQGWHLPTMNEWETLAQNQLELKEEGTQHWMSPNNCFPNNSGFNALPGGNCGYDGNFNGLTESGYWWTATEENQQNAWISIMDHQNMGHSGWVNADKWVGGSIRCVKD